MDNLKWDDLSLFLAAQEAGSCSGAARALRMEQSTVSRRIAALESSLGSAVFLRSRRGLVLTDLGQRILPLAQEARERIAELTSISRAAKVEGTVRLALTESLAVYGLISSIGDLLEEHPALRLHLVSSTDLSDLSRREADLALRLCQTERGDLLSKCVTRLPNGVWGHPRWRARSWDALEWVSLSADVGRGSHYSWVENNVARPPRVISNGFVAMVEAMRKGLGVGLVPDSLGYQVPELVRLESPAPPAPTPVYLVVHRASRDVPRVAVVWSFLESYLRNMPGEL